MSIAKKTIFGISEAIVQQLVDRIVAECNPHKIILFGSYAWGQPDAGSDFDLFVIMDSHLRRDRRAMMISELFPHRRFAIDVIVYTPAEIERSLARGNPFIREILERGNVLYDRQHEFSGLARQSQE